MIINLHELALALKISVEELKDRFQHKVVIKKLEFTWPTTQKI